MTAAYQTSTSLRQGTTAVSLARELLEEVAGEPFYNPLDATAQTAAAVNAARSQFNQVGQYNNYSDLSSTITALDGSTVAVGNETYTRNVKVTFGTAPSVDTGSPATDFALVTVTVTAPGGQQVALTRTVTNYTFVR